MDPLSMVGLVTAVVSTVTGGAIPQPPLGLPGGGVAASSVEAGIQSSIGSVGARTIFAAAQSASALLPFFR